MSTALAISRRELSSLFRVPVGWVVIALFLFLTGVTFVNGTLRPGEPATLRYFFSTAGVLLIPIVPAISMRLFSEEIRTGTIETLRTAPVWEEAAILGKYLAGLGFLICLFLPTLVFPVILAATSTAPGPDWGPVLSGYLGLMLTGALYLAIGTLASTTTASQTLAFLGTLILIALLILLSEFVAPKTTGLASRVLAYLSIPTRTGEFAKGVIDLRHVAFFVGGTMLALAGASASLGVRRWR